MKAISLWQPWASLVPCRAKGYETRSWPAPQGLVGQDLVICAAKNTKAVKELLSAQVGQMAALQEICVQRGLLQRYADVIYTTEALYAAMGHVLAVVNLRCCFQMTEESIAHHEISPAEKAVGGWTPGRWAWGLGGVRVLTVPVPVLGRQGVWNLTEKEAAAVSAALPEAA